MRFFHGHRSLRANKVPKDPVYLRALMVVVALGSLAGCSTIASSLNPAFSGSVYGGKQPLSQASLEMYAMGTAGDASAATPLLSKPVFTDANGNFTIPAGYTCPSASAEIYLAAKGGNPGLTAGTNNTSIAEVAILGPCGELTEATRVTINEATTVGAVWSLASFMSSTDHLGSGAADLPQLNAALQEQSELVNTTLGAAPGTAVASGSTAPTEKLNTLANILATCIDSSGTTSGDSPCGQLFTLASTVNQAAPSDTVQAALAIAHAPTQNVSAIFDLQPTVGPFQASLSAAPIDWTLTMQPAIAAPLPSIAVKMTPSTVTLAPAQTASFTATVTGSQNKGVLWSLNPSLGSINAGVYTAPSSLNQAATVTVTATSASDPKVKAVGTIFLKPAVGVTVTPSAGAITSQQTQQFTAAVSGSTNTAVTWRVSPASGSISSTGLYTPPNALQTSETVTVTATSVADTTKSASALLSVTPVPTGAQYYLSPSGKDSNNGLTATTPWLTPNHQGLNCGDTIVAAPGNYNAMTITATPACATHNAVWVKCATFDGCKINQDVWSQGGIDVQASYWAFLGWEVTARTGPYASCFSAIPSGTATASIHDIYFINDIANGCMAGGFIAANSGAYSVDYLAVIADVVYNAAQGNAYCYSGVSILQPTATDQQSGSHIYISQVFAWQNLEPATCAGGKSTDGEGIILDTFNGYYAGFAPYAQQAAIENVIAVYNGAFGILAGGGSGNSHSPMFVRNATTYGNFINTNQDQGLCAQMASYGWPTTDAASANRYTNFTNNLAVTNTNRLSGCGNNTPYAYYFGNIDGTDSFAGNAGYSASGQTIGYTGLTTGFVKGTNAVGTDPSLANPVEPGAPSCSTASSVIDCMAPVIANFKPRNPAYTSYGYQPPSLTPVNDPLFPRWLCGNPNMPSGLVTMGCLAQ